MQVRAGIGREAGEYDRPAGRRPGSSDVLPLTPEKVPVRAAAEPGAAEAGAGADPAEALPDRAGPAESAEFGELPQAVTVTAVTRASAQPDNLANFT